MASRLGLFDIDGTLLTTNGRAVAAMMEALGEVYGVRPHHDGFLMDGKTELRIVHELLEAEGVPAPVIGDRLPEFWSRYGDALAAHIRPEVTTVYPGVPGLLAELRAHPQVALGVLTGNCPAAAEIKLRAAGLEGLFAFGAFGDAHQDRGDLPGLALDAARQALDIDFPGSAAVVLGDTPNDILCARPLGLRTIAVATGRYDREQLAAHHPDYLFEDFSDSAQVMEAILAA